MHRHPRRRIGRAAAMAALLSVGALAGCAGTYASGYYSSGYGYYSDPLVSYGVPYYRSTPRYYYGGGPGYYYGHPRYYGGAYVTPGPVNVAPPVRVAPPAYVAPRPGLGFATPVAPAPMGIARPPMAPMAVPPVHIR